MDTSTSGLHRVDLLERAQVVNDVPLFKILSIGMIAPVDGCAKASCNFPPKKRKNTLKRDGDEKHYRTNSQVELEIVDQMHEFL